MISVLIADDQDLVREGLRMMLDAHPELAIPPETHFVPDLIKAARAEEGTDGMLAALTENRTWADWVRHLLRRAGCDVTLHDVSTGPVTPPVGPPPNKCGSSVAKPSLPGRTRCWRTSALPRSCPRMSSSARSP